MVDYIKKPYFIAVLICIFIFYSGIFKISEKNKFYSLVPSQEVCSIKGQLISSPVKLSNKKYYSTKFQVSECTCNSGIKSSADGILTVYIPSDFVEALFPGKLYSAAKNNGAFLFEAGAFFKLNGRMLSEIFYVDNAENCGFPSGIFGKIDKFRAEYRLYFKKLMYSWSEAGGFLLALLTGAREYTDDSIKDAFKKTGLSHILALSGMHLSLFSGIAMFIGKKSKRKKISFIIRVIFLIIFVWFAGFSPSLLRAFICAMLMIFSSMVTKDNPDMIMILCFSFLLQCIISPSDIYNTGFILSYGALAGILFFNNSIRKITNKFMSNYFSASISASTSAQILTVPISLKLFGTFTPIGIIATSVISPLVTIFIYSGLVLIILSLLFPVISHASGIFVNFEYNIIRNLVFLFSKLPFYWSIN